MQGMLNKYTLVLIDGVRFNDPSNTNGANISHLLLDNIERIEIIKGAQSGVWGADAAAGVINIITKEANPGFNASSSMEMGKYGHKHATLNLSYRTPLSDASLSISRLLYDGPTAQAPRGESLKQYEDDPYRNTTVQTKVGHWIDPDNRVEAGYRDVNSFVHYDGLNDPNSFETAKYREKSGFANYQHFSGAHSFTLSASKSEFKSEHFETTPYMYRGEIEEIELRDRFKYSDEGVLVFGASYRDDEAKYKDDLKNIRNQAGFINNTYSLNRWIFSQALRYDIFSEFDNKITGKLGLSYKITPEISVYANAGTAYKTPSILDMANPWGLSNFDLEPENIQSYNVGLHFYALHVNLFQNRIKDMIDWIKGRNENISGTSKSKGVEVSLEQAISKKWLAGSSYTYTDARDKDKKRLTRRSRYQANGFVTYVPMKDLKLTTSGSYIGSRKDSKDVETGRYFLANLKADYEVNKRWSIYAKLNNIFDKKYQEVDGYATLGRSFYAGFRVDF
ncbi:MAG: TonB-dependent receptor, partial [Campylobacteraceae bacterium]|nr:TonB-dependent receptor [Campylobacteraceae bacterium]